MARKRQFESMTEMMQFFKDSGAKGGQKRAATMTKAERSEGARKAAAARWQMGLIVKGNADLIVRGPKPTEESAHRLADLQRDNKGARLLSALGENGLVLAQKPFPLDASAFAWMIVLEHQNSLNRAALATNNEDQDIMDLISAWRRSAKARAERKEI